MVISEKETKYIILQCDNPACEHRECKRVDYYEGNPPMTFELFPSWQFGNAQAVAISMRDSVLPASDTRHIGFHACCPDCIPEAIAEVIRAHMEERGVDGMRREEVDFTSE